MKQRNAAFLVGGLLVALLLAGVVSNFASSHPDGLDSSLREGCTFDADDNVTGGSCPAQQAKGHELGGSPLAGYGIKGVQNTYLSNGLAGVTGVLLTFALGGGLFWLTRRRGSTPTPTPAPAPTSAPAPVSAPPASADSGSTASADSVN